jgi:hypothetical protein
MNGKSIKKTLIITVILAAIASCKNRDKADKIKVEVEKARILSQPSFDDAIKRSLEKSSKEKDSNP